MAEHVLPDYLRPDLDVIVCGTAVGTTSARRGHYYAGPGNEFWQLLHQGRLTSEELTPEEDRRVLDFGIGLTDLAKRVVASSDRHLDGEFDVAGFVARIEAYRPHVIAFHGKKAAAAVSRYLRQGRRVHLGLQRWQIGDSRVFVLPSASGANRDVSRLEGKSSRVDWYRELSEFLRELGGGYRGTKAS